MELALFESIGQVIDNGYGCKRLSLSLLLSLSLFNVVAGGGGRLLFFVLFSLLLLCCASEKAPNKILGVGIFV